MSNACTSEDFRVPIFLKTEIFSAEKNGFAVGLTERFF